MGDNRSKKASCFLKNPSKQDRIQKSTENQRKNISEGCSKNQLIELKKSA